MDIKGDKPMNGVVKTRTGIVALICLSMICFPCCGKRVNKSGGASLSSEQTLAEKNAPRYHEFVDVLIPGELKVDTRSTYVVQMSGFATGILVLNGRVERDSLVSFFQSNMTRDNWEVITVFKSPRTNSFLLFKKANRWCVIGIQNKQFTTHVEIGVAPASQTDGSGN
jgi:hypothetical protein